MDTLLLNEAKLGKQSFTRGASPEFVHQLAKFSNEISFAAGQIVFKENELADRFYLILSGKIELETKADHGVPVKIQTLGPGDLLGWSWLFAPFRWHFTATAAEPCTALSFNGASLLIRAEENPVFGYELMKRISRQVIQRLQMTRERYVRECAVNLEKGPDARI
jgi:CRP-like cAMP-binding protein